MPSGDMIWRQDLDALVFRPKGYQGGCFVHRLAFRFHDSEASRESCKKFFRANVDAFERAAQAKIRRGRVLDGENFHLTSRDIRRAMSLPRDAS
jgi:hypothetical protein